MFFFFHPSVVWLPCALYLWQDEKDDDDVDIDEDDDVDIDKDKADDDMHVCFVLLLTLQIPRISFC